MIGGFKQVRGYVKVAVHSARRGHTYPLFSVREPQTESFSMGHRDGRNEEGSANWIILVSGVLLAIRFHIP